MPNMSPGTRSVLRFAPWVIATALAIVVLKTIDLTAVGALVRRAHTGWIAVALITNLLILFCWTQQWRVLVPPVNAVSFRRMLPLIGMTSLAGNSAPVSGQVSAAVLLASEPTVPRSVAVAIVAVDQIVEGVTKILLISLAALVAPLPGWLRQSVVALVIAMVLLVSLFALFARQNAWFAQYADAMRLVSNRARITASVGWSCCSKAAELFAIVAVQRAFDVDLSLSTTLLVLASVHIGTLVPLMPGNIGTYEASATFAYRQAGVAQDLAVSIAVAQHICLLLSTAGVGYLMFVFRDRIRGRESHTAISEASQ